MTLQARDTATGQVVTLTGDPASADGLTPGPLAAGRYRCMSCGNPLGLSRRSGAHSSYAPRFSHGHNPDDGPDGCPARTAVKQEVEAGLQVVIDLQTQLVKAWPGTTSLIECPEPQAPGQPSPPAVIVAQTGGQLLVIECPHGPLNEDSVRRRINSVRARYGSGAAHVWFLTEHEHHFRQGGLKDKSVRPAGATASVRHMRVRPTQQQLQIVEAGGAVYWVNGGTVYVPYGGHDFTHEPRHGENWGADVARFRYDWEISQPQPEPGAQWWGLVPIGLSSLRGGRVGFHPADAHEVMERLEQSQGARWASSRRRARQRYEELHRQPLPNPTASPAARPAAPEKLPPAAPSPSSAEPGSSPAEERNEPMPASASAPPMPTHAPYIPPALPQPRGPLSRLLQWARRKG